MAARQPVVNVDDYLARERAAQAGVTRSEYVNGQVIPVSGGSREHSLIATNITSEIGHAVRGKNCETYAGTMRVKVSQTGMYTYPDVVVVCGEPRFEDEHLDTLLNPTVLVEILSPGAALDPSVKFAYYRRLESLKDFVIVSEDRVHVEHYGWQSDGRWVLGDSDDLNAKVRLESIDCTLPLSVIYDRVNLGGETRGRG